MNKTALLVIICLLVGTVMATYLAFRNPNMEGDSVYYLVPIHNWMAGDGYTFQGQPHTNYSPGYGLLSYLPAVLLDDIEYGGMVVSAAAYVLSIAVSAAVAYRFFSPRAAVLAALFVTLAPVFIQFSYQTMTESAFTLFTLLAFGLYLDTLTPRPPLPLEERGSKSPSPVLGEGFGVGGKYILLGIVLGFLFLIRPEGIFLAAAVWLSLLILIRRRVILLGIAVFIMMIFPYLLFLRQHVGEWTLGGKASITLIYYGELGEGRPQAELDALLEQNPAYFEQSPLEYVLERNVDLLPRVRKNLTEGGSRFFGMTRHAMIPTIGLLFLPPFRRDFFKDTLPFLVFLSPAAVYLFFYTGYRFMLPYSVIALVGLAVLADRLAQGNKKLILAVGIGLFTLTSLFPMYQSIALESVLKERHYLREVRALGLWMGENLEMEDKTLLGTGKIHVMSFYASGKKEPVNRFIQLPPSLTVPKIADYAGQNGVDYVVLGASPVLPPSDFRRIYADESFQIYAYVGE